MLRDAAQTELAILARERRGLGDLLRGEWSWVAAGSADSAARFAARVGIPYHSDRWRDVIEDPTIEAVDIVAPNDLHAAVAIAAAEAGKAILIEKPLARSLDEADRIVEAVTRCGVILVYAENRRFSPALQRMHRAVADGSLGRPLFLRITEMGSGPGHGAWFWNAERAGGGALIGAFGLASIRQVRRQGLVLVASGLLFSATLAAFAVSPGLEAGLVLLFIAGVSSTVFGTIVMTLIQIATPNELRGRVMSLYAITLIGLPSLGALGSGVIAEWLGGIQGAPHAVLIGAVLLGIVLIAISPFFWNRSMTAHAAASKP